MNSRRAAISRGSARGGDVSNSVTSGGSDVDVGAGVGEGVCGDIAAAEGFGCGVGSGRDVGVGDDNSVGAGAFVGIAMGVGVGSTAVGMGSTAVGVGVGPGVQATASIERTVTTKTRRRFNDFGLPVGTQFLSIMPGMPSWSKENGPGPAAGPAWWLRLASLLLAIPVILSACTDGSTATATPTVHIDDVSFGCQLIL